MSTLKEICKDQRELLNECRQNIKELTEENKKLKEQIDTSQVSRLIAENEQLKTERDTLIDDIAVLKANISRLELENEKQLDLLQDFSKFINYKLVVCPANDSYKHYRSELDKLGVK